MRLGDVSAALAGEELVLRATVSSVALGRPFAAEVRIPLERAGQADVSANPFLPAAAVAAGALHEDLDVDGPADPELLAAAADVARTIAARDGGRAPAIDAPSTLPVRPLGDERWLLFTRGVDSTYSLLSLRPELDRLLFVAGVEPAWDESTEAQVVAATAEAASAAGLELVTAATNLRGLVEPLVPYLDCHHAVLAGPALALGRGIGVAYAAGGTALRPPLWHLLASGATRFVLHGQPVSRATKAALVAAEPGWPERLKVCWSSGLAGNCGRCPKCVTTMVYLLGSSGDERVLSAFPEPLSETLVDEVAVQVADLMVDTPTLLAAYVAWGLPELLDRLPPRYVAVRDRFHHHFGSSFPEVAVRLAGGDDQATGLDATGRARAAVPRWRGPHLLEVGWEDGRLPLRPRASDAELVRRACREAGERAVPWAVIGPDEEADGRLVDLLQRAWGPGVVHAWHPAPGAGLEPDQARRLLRASSVRVWWGDGSTLRAGPLLAALEQGCLPLQALDRREHPRLAARLPAGLRAALLPIDGEPPPALGDDERRERLEAILSVVLAGSLERDLALARG